MLKYLSIDGHFGINILSEQQRDLSELLSRNWDERFSGLEWRPGHTGVPLLTGVAAAMECVITDMIPAGDHTVVFGRVLHAIRAEDSPLVYANRSYGRIAPLPIA
jgi:flavin reductase (DIM6/NTAB) family NADH-FMN oxidoreductase RutF